MTQPDWKLAVNLGDVDPIDHGGFFVFQDTTGTYPPMVEHWLTPEETEEQVWSVYRFNLEPCTFENGVLSDNPDHKDIPAGFAKDLESVADSMGTSVEELVESFCSDDPLARGVAWRVVVDYYGPHEFDSDPLHLTRAEIEARYLAMPKIGEPNGS